MGMIFNTTNTHKILELLSARYGVGHINDHRGDAAILERVDHTRNKAHDLHIELQGGDNQKWQTWLNKMDDHGGWGDQITRAMGGFLRDNKCIAIEFHPIESDSVQVIISPSLPQGADYYASILIETPTYDKAVGFERSLRNRI